MTRSNFITSCSSVNDMTRCSSESCPRPCVGWGETKVHGRTGVFMCVCLFVYVSNSGYFCWKGSVRGFGDLVDFDGLSWGGVLSLVCLTWFVGLGGIVCIVCIVCIVSIVCIVCIVCFSCLPCIPSLEVSCFWQEIHMIFYAYISIISGRNK